MSIEAMHALVLRVDKLEEQVKELQRIVKKK
jgi:tetrahydromethanopterin S-methyltransferase subunit B